MAEEVTKTYWAKFGLDASNFIGGITAAQKEFLAFTAAVTASVAVFTLAFNEYSRLVEKYGSMANELQDLSYATGISTEEIQKFHYAATLSGDNIGMVDAMLGKLTLSMGQFADKASPAAKAFDRLGVDPTGKSTAQVFVEIAEAMKDIPDAGTKASIAIDILGKSYRDSLPYMKEFLENQDKIKAAMTFSEADQANAARAREGWASFWYSVDVFFGKTLFGAPEATKEKIDSISQYWRNIGYDEDQIKKALVSNYGLDALQKLGYYGETGTPGSSRIDFTSPFAGLNDTSLALEKLNRDLVDYNAQMEAARQEGNQKAFEKAALGARETELAIKALMDTTRDQTLIYQQMIDIQLPRLKENLEKAKATGLKTEIEAAEIALKQGVNSANDLGIALGKAAISADNIKASITPAAGWSYKDIVGTAGSEMQTFMLDEMNHGATYADALNAWHMGAHSYAAFTGAYGEGTLGAAANAGITITRNPGRNEREAMAAAGSSTASTTTGSTEDSPLAAETKAQKTELDKQLKTVETHLVDVHKTYLEGYLKIEKLDREHWTFLTEEMKTSLGNLTDNYVKFVKYVADNPTIMNIGIVTWTKAGADWDPTHNAEFMQTVRMSAMISSVPEYKSVDLSKIEFAGSSSQKTKGDTNVQINQTFNGSTDPQAVKDATKDAASEALAEDAITRGWN